MVIWDTGELLSMNSPESSRLVAIIVVGLVMAMHRLQAPVRENERREASTQEQLEEVICLTDLDLFETLCKIPNIPRQVKKRVTVND